MDHQCVLGENEWCTAGDPCFTCAETAHQALHPNGDVDGCVQCHHQSIQLSPAATPTSRNSIAPAKPRNSWEKGQALDRRGIPYVNKDGTPIGVKDFANNRSRYEETLRQQHAGVVT